MTYTGEQVMRVAPDQSNDHQFYTGTRKGGLEGVKACRRTQALLPPPEQERQRKKKDGAADAMHDRDKPGQRQADLKQVEVFRTIRHGRAYGILIGRVRPSNRSRRHLL